MFRSFFQAGFECATAINKHRHRIDQVAATQHDRFVEQDYRLLRGIGIQTVREGVRWNLIDRKGHYDFSSLIPLLKASQKYGIEVIYDLFHFGYPADLIITSRDFIQRFADYCYASAKLICSRTDGPYYFTPINEPSYFSWAGGEAGLFAPFLTGQGWPLKIHLIRAAIAGVEAIRAICPEARIVHADSLCRVVAPFDRPDLQQEALRFNDEAVFQSWDMLCGKLLPELGGNRDVLDIVGINYYWTNQWQIDQPGIPLADDDPRKVSLGELITSVWDRYEGDILITETSHVNEQRAPWLIEAASECNAVLEKGIRLAGLCWYPILSMPEWHAQDVWTHMGIWDLARDGNYLRRVVHEPVLQELNRAQHLHSMMEKIFFKERRVS